VASGDLSEEIFTNASIVVGAPADTARTNGPFPVLRVAVVTGAIDDGLHSMGKVWILTSKPFHCVCRWRGPAVDESVIFPLASELVCSLAGVSVNFRRDDDSDPARTLDEMTLAGAVSRDCCAMRS
jgi:hypothetical protein